MVGTSHQSVPEMAIDKVFENLFPVQFPSIQWRSEVMVSDEQVVQSAKPIGGMILQVVPHSIRQKNMAIYVYVIYTNIIQYIYKYFPMKPIDPIIFPENSACVQNNPIISYLSLGFFNDIPDA